jgi:hypothetical protein
VISKRSAILLYCLTAAIFLAMTPARWWLQDKVGFQFIVPDLVLGMDTNTLGEFQSALARPVGNSTGTAWFLTLHTFSLDLLLPALTALSIAVFLLRTGASLPAFNAMERRAKWLFCVIIGVPGMMVDYVENYQVAKIITSDQIPTDRMASMVTVLTTLKFSCLVFAALVCGTFLLATLRHKKNL